jgi:hypothetical protein
MNATSDQIETLLRELERRARVLQDCSEKLETQLKVMLVQQSRGHFPNELVARIAHALALCLSSRGDRAQAGQYAMMAANLERRQGGARPPAGGSPVRLEMSAPDAASSGRRERAASAGPGEGSLGPAPRRHLAFGSMWGAWVGLNRRTAKRLGW